jgi:hypothetical protein
MLMGSAAAAAIGAAFIDRPYLNSAAQLTVFLWLLLFMFLALFFMWRLFRYLLSMSFGLRHGLLGQRLEALWNIGYGWRKKDHTDASLAAARMFAESLLMFLLAFGGAVACHWSLSHLRDGLAS